MSHRHVKKCIYDPTMENVYYKNVLLYVLVHNHYETDKSQNSNHDKTDKSQNSCFYHD